MKYSVVFVVLIFSGLIFEEELKGADLPQLSFAQDSCGNSGLWGIGDWVSLEWEKINSSPMSSCVILTVTPKQNEPFVRFAFRGKDELYRFFFKPVLAFSHEKDVLKTNFERRLKKRSTSADPECDTFETMKIWRSVSKEPVTSEEMKKLEQIGFSEFSGFAENIQSFFSMFDAYPVLYSSNDERVSMFFMPRRKELAIAIVSKKDFKDVTICRSSATHDTFLLWKITIVNGHSTLIEYSDREKLFWIDEDVDGIPEFCLEQHEGSWLKSACECGDDSPGRRS